MADSTARRAPPDGGWGWVIAGVAFIINGIILGIHNSFGLFLDYFIENHVFGVTDKDTAAVAAVGSLSFGMTFMFGPLSGILCDQVGLRLTVIIGSVIAVAGVLTTSFCNELYQLYITYGVLWGCGSSLCYTASFVALGRYFHKRISFVNGLATAGSGIGGLALTPLINWLLTTSDWRVTYQVLAGVCSLLAICGIFVRPADPSKSKKTSCLCCVQKKTVRKSRHHNALALQQVKKDENNEIGNKSPPKSKNLKSIHKQTEKNSGNNLKKKQFSIRFEDEVVAEELQSRNDRLSQMEAIEARTRSNSSSSRDDNDGIVLNLDYGKADEIEIGQRATDTSAPSPDQRKRRFKCRPSCSLSKKITSCLDFSNWRKKSYIAWVLSAAVVETCYFTPYIYLVRYARGIGIDKDRSNMLVAYLGIVATASKLLVGKICDHPKMNRVYFTQICILFMAVCITCLPLTTNYGGVLAFVIVFGWFDGCYTALLAVITLDVTGPAKYAQGLGQLYIVMSINNIFGPIIIGEIYALTSSFEIPFFIAGGVFFLGCCNMYFIHYFSPVQSNYMDRNSSSDSVSSMGSGRRLRRSSSFAGFDVSNYAVPIMGVAYSARIRKRHKLNFKMKAKKHQKDKEAVPEKDYRNADPSQYIVIDHVSVV
ncbi:Monocarboxylate transporter 5 [Trichoplax sp. H2]|nr:Monocarboxylate transporter 5 [Trichoplax sp. H2]|eukprot:RDD46584.1 Monocarboxylate transporter 5 [Trichoplax sp. H2]